MSRFRWQRRSRFRESQTWGTTHDHTVVLHRGRDGWRWTRFARNNDRVAGSLEGYTNRQDCLDMALQVNPMIQVGPDTPSGAV